jgi:hypothetical protein
MANKWSDRFANMVNTLNNLELAWSHAKAEGTDTTQIEKTVYRLISEMSDDELRAHSEYMQERHRQAQEEISNLSHALAEMEAERERRKAR